MFLTNPSFARPHEDAREHLGRHIGTIDGLAHPVDVAIGAQGGVVVLEAGAGRVSIHDPAGGEARVLGRTGSGQGELQRPAGIALAPDGRILVSDAGRRGVLVFSPEGAPLAAFGARGSAAGELARPAGLCTDGRRVWVADPGNERVSVFEIDGRFVAQVESAGAERLRRPVDVALDRRGRLFVLDAASARVHRIAADGSGAASFGAQGAQFGLLDEPASLAVANDLVLVAERFNHRVQAFDLDGRPLYLFGGAETDPGPANGRLFQPAGVAVDAAGRLAAVVEPLVGRVQLFAEAPPHETGAHALPHPDVERCVSRLGPRGGSDGRWLALIEPELRSVLVLDVEHVSPVPIASFAQGAGPFRLEAPLDAAVDSRAGRVFVSDPFASRVVVWELCREAAGARGRFVRALDFEPLKGRGPLAGLEWTVQPGALELARDGTLYVADERNAAVVVLDQSLSVRRVLGGFGEEPGSLCIPVDLALSPGEETLAVLDAGRRRIVRFETGSLGPGGGIDAGAALPGEPAGLLLLPDGRRLVSDVALDAIHVLGPLGEPGALLGGRGAGAGRFQHPSGLLRGPAGAFYVLDVGNRRGQVLSDAGEFRAAF